MTVYTQKWGNSRGIRIPKAILDTLDIKNTDPLKIVTEDNQIVIFKKKERDISAELEQFDGAYVLTEEDRVWLDAKPVGNEIW